jgi:pimeloyl-ACP methyl ester carboxylesterase
MNDSTIPLSDGRMFAFTDIGAPDGTPMIHSHGAPSSRLELAILDAAFKEAGLRVITPDRPGYGGSSPQPGRTLADWPTDVAALADAIGVERFVVTAISAGGPYAMACCALLPARVRGGFVSGGVGDFSWPNASEDFPQAELDFMASPTESAALEYAVEHFGADGAGFFEADPFEWSEPDAAMFEDEAFAGHFESVMGAAFGQGIGGYAQDVFVQSRPWPFDPGTITVPVAVVHGELDAVVPASHSRELASRVPGAVLRELPGQGHISGLLDLPGWIAEFIESLD